MEIIALLYLNSAKLDIVRIQDDWIKNNLK